MMRDVLHSLIWPVLVLAITTSENNGALAGAGQDRLDQEARVLFQLVMSQEKAPKRCQYDQGWDEYAIPDYVARQVFKIRIYGGVVAPFQVGGFQATVDPDTRHSGAFCSAAEVKAFAEEQVRAFEASSDSDMHIDRTRFTYPVFDEQLRTAVVVVSYIADEGRFRWGGKIGRHPESFVAVAKVYKKIRGKWRFESSQQLAIS